MNTVTNIEIIDFDPSLAKDFKALNIAWLQKYFVVEPIDEEMLSNPQEYIIDKGGFIFFAKWDDELAGTCALMKAGEGIFELSKMAVDEAFQGKKIGNALLQHSLAFAKQQQAKKVLLYSNTKLQPAIHLYKKAGFIEMPLDHSEYKRANIKMEITL